MKKIAPKKATDTQLLARFEQGRDQSAFAEIVRRYGSMVFATAMRRLHNRHEAEEAYQATFLALAKAAAQLGSGEFIAAWLHKTAYRTSSSIRRGLVRRNNLMERLMEQADAQNPNVDTNHTNPAVAIANDEALEVLDEELSKLASKLQTAVVLCHIEGLTQQQAAKRLGVTASTVNDRLAKGRNALKVKLVQRGITLTLAGFSTYIASTSKALAAVSSSPVADTTARAALYAAGHSASDIGVSNLVFNEANRVIATMTTTKIASVFLTVLAILFLGGPIAAVVGMNGFGNARAGTFFLDTFDDMNINDEAPFSWTADGGGTILDATSGDLVISQPLAGEGSFAVIDNYAYDDVSVRSLVGVAGDTFREVGVGVRGIVGNSAIYASISGTGAAFGAAAPKSLVIYRIRGGSPPVILTQVPTNLDPTSMDVWLQLDASGDDLKFSAWADGIPKTSISAQDSIQSGDVVGIIYNGAESATFRSFETLPEPSGASLSILGLLVATSWFRISRR